MSHMQEESSILVIEPSKLFRKILNSQMEPLGLKADFVGTKDEALEQLKITQTYKLICCANELVKGNGVEFVKDIRPIIGQSTPYLLLSTHPEKALIRSALLNGITEVIQRNHLIEIQPYLQQIANENIEPKNKHPHILFVEDSQSVAMMTLETLTQHGYIVDITETAEEAITMLDNKDYDIVISDILLEGDLTGLNLIRHIRKLEEPKNHIPILAISGLNTQSQKIESLRMGATDFISKPLNYEELEVRVENLIRTKRLFERVFEQGQQLQKLAMTDPLTELYNRHYLTDIMPKRLAEAQRHDQHLSLVLIDLDKFKSINDTYGHLQGDHVLKEVSVVLQENCRNEDFVVRFGGEEFILVLPHCDIDSAEDKANDIKDQIQSLHFDEFTVTASMGVSGKRQNTSGVTFNELFELADEAVYQAKDNGRNLVIASQEL